MTRRVAFVPAAPLLLPEYAGIDDPAAPLRAACRQAVAWLTAGSDGFVSVLAPPPDPANVARGVGVSLGRRVAGHLLAEAGFDGRVDEPEPATAGASVLVLGSGSARRGERAPGHLDERSFAFDEATVRALTAGDTAALGALDEALAGELLADGVPVLRAVAGALGGSEVVRATTLYADDPFGVQYWVVTWQCAS